MSIIPLRKNVVAQRAVEEEVTDGGIVIPDSVVKDQDEATVVAVGPDLRNNIAVGNRIIIDTYGGQNVIDDDGTKYVVIDEDDIVALIGG